MENRIAIAKPKNILSLPRALLTGVWKANSFRRHCRSSAMGRKKRRRAEKKKRNGEKKKHSEAKEKIDISADKIVRPHCLEMEKRKEAAKEKQVSWASEVDEESDNEEVSPPSNSITALRYKVSTDFPQTQSLVEIKVGTVDNLTGGVEKSLSKKTTEGAREGQKEKETKH